MSSNQRRAAARRRAWGRGPIILRFERLEDRQLLTAVSLPDMAGVAISLSTTSAVWGQSFDVSGKIINQGNATVSKPFDVEILASANSKIGPDSLSLGDFTVPAGLAPGETASYDQQVTLPPTALAGFTGKPIYIQTYINPGREITESNYHNDQGVGFGLDTAPLTMTQVVPANLVGTTFTISPNQVQWGQQVTITAQIHNDAAGAAPATQAAITLTPAGSTVGTGQDAVVGYLSVPAIPAWQTVNVVQTITLPAVPPLVLANSSQFTISMIQDSNYVTNVLYPHEPTQGAGLDSTQIVVGIGPDSATVQNPLPDLAAGGIVAPTTAIHWGQSFQVSAGIQNIGQGNAGPFDVVFLLTGASGALSPAIYLGNEEVSGLAAGANQTLVPNLQLPGVLPSGLALNSLGVGLIAMEIDPQYTVNESTKTNNIAFSNPVTLRLLGTDGTTTVPTAPPPGQILGTPQPQGTLKATSQPKAQGTIIGARWARRAAAVHYVRLHLHTTPKKTSLTTTVVDKIENFPKQINKAFENLL